MSERQHPEGHRPPGRAGHSTVASTAEFAERGLACCVVGGKNTEYRYFRRLLGLWSHSLKGPVVQQPQVKLAPQTGSSATSGSIDIGPQQIVSATDMGSEVSSVQTSSQGSAVPSRAVIAASDNAGTTEGNPAPAGALSPVPEGAIQPLAEQAQHHHDQQQLQQQDHEADVFPESATIRISAAERVQFMHELQLQQETILRMLQSAVLPTPCPATPGNSNNTPSELDLEPASPLQQGQLTCYPEVMLTQFADHEHAAVVSVSNNMGPANDAMRRSALTIKTLAVADHQHDTHDDGPRASADLPTTPRTGRTDVQVLSPTSAGRAAAAAVAGTSAAAGRTYSANSSIRSGSHALALSRQTSQQQQQQQGTHASLFRHTTEFDPFVSSSNSSKSSNDGSSSVMLAAAAAAISNSCGSSTAGQEPLSPLMEQQQHFASPAELNAAVHLYTASAAANAVDAYNSGHQSAAAQYLIAAAAAAHFQNYVNPLSGLDEPLEHAELDNLAQDLADDESSLVALTDIYLRKMSMAGSEIEPLLQDLLDTSDQYPPQMPDTQQQQQMKGREQRLLQLLRHLNFSYDGYEPTTASTVSLTRGKQVSDPVARSSVSSIPILPPPTPTASATAASEPHVQGYRVQGSVENSQQQGHSDLAAGQGGRRDTSGSSNPGYSMSMWNKGFLEGSTMAEHVAALLGNPDVARKVKDVAATRDQGSAAAADKQQQLTSGSAARWRSRLASRRGMDHADSAAAAADDKYFSISDAASTVSDIALSDIAVVDTAMSENMSKDSLAFTDNCWSDDGSGSSGSREVAKTASGKQTVSSAAAEASRDSSTVSRYTHDSSSSAWLSGLLWPVPKDVEVLHSPQQRKLVAAAAAAATSSSTDVVGLLLRSLTGGSDREASSQDYNAQEHQQQQQRQEEEGDHEANAWERPAEHQELTAERQRQLLAALLASTSSVHTTTVTTTAAAAAAAPRYSVLHSPASVSTLSPASPGLLGYYYHDTSQPWTAAVAAAAPAESPSAAAAAAAYSSPDSGASGAEVMHNPLFEPVERLLCSLAYSDPVMMSHHDQGYDHDHHHARPGRSYNNLMDAAAGLSEPSQKWLQDIQQQLRQQQQEPPAEAAAAADTGQHLEEALQQLQHWQQQILDQSPTAAGAAAAAVPAGEISGSAGHKLQGLMTSSAGSAASDVLGRLLLDVMELNGLLQTTGGSLGPALVNQLKELLHNETFVTLTQHVHNLQQQQQQQQQESYAELHPQQQAAHDPSASAISQLSSDAKVAAVAAAAAQATRGPRAAAAAPFASITSLRALNVSRDDPGGAMSSDSVLLGSPAFSKSKKQVAGSSTTSSKTVQGYSVNRDLGTAAAASAAAAGSTGSSRAIDPALRGSPGGEDASSPKSAALVTVAAELNPQQQQQQQQFRELSPSTTFSSNFSAAAPYVATIQDAITKVSIASNAVSGGSTGNQAAAAAAAAAAELAGAADIDHATAMAALRERVRLQMEQQSFSRHALQAMATYQGVSQQQAAKPTAAATAAAAAGKAGYTTESRKTPGVRYSDLRAATKAEGDADQQAAAHERTLLWRPAHPVDPDAAAAAVAAAAGSSPGEVLSRSVSPVSMDAGGESSDLDDDLLAGIGPAAAAGSSPDHTHDDPDTPADQGGSSGDRYSGMVSHPDSISSLEALSLRDLRELLSRVAKASLKRLRKKQQQQQRRQQRHQGSHHYQQHDLDRMGVESELPDVHGSKQQQQQQGDPGSAGSSAGGSAFSFRQLASLHAADTPSAAVTTDTAEPTAAATADAAVQRRQQLVSSVESLPRPRQCLKQRPVIRKPAAAAAAMAAAAAAVGRCSTEIEPIEDVSRAESLSVAAWGQQQQQQQLQLLCNQARVSNSVRAERGLPVSDQKTTRADVAGVSVSSSSPLTPTPTAGYTNARGSTDNSAASLIQALRLLAHTDPIADSPVASAAAAAATAHQVEQSSTGFAQESVDLHSNPSDHEVNLESLSLSQLGALLRAARSPRQRRRQVVPDELMRSMSQHEWRERVDQEYVEQQQQQQQRKCVGPDGEVSGIRSMGSIVDDQGVDQSAAAAAAAAVATAVDVAVEPSP